MQELGGNLDKAVKSTTRYFVSNTFIEDASFGSFCMLETSSGSVFVNKNYGLVVSIGIIGEQIEKPLINL